MDDEQPDEPACCVIGCAVVLGGPRDTPTMCADCAQWIEDERREMRREGGE